MVTLAGYFAGLFWHREFSSLQRKNETGADYRCVGMEGILLSYGGGCLFVSPSFLVDSGCRLGLAESWGTRKLPL